jgi:hypothetical protein
VIGILWLATVVGGFWLWERYDATPGTASTTALTADVANDGRWRLTVFAHPRCPCTRAALREVAELAAARPELAIRVLFIRPSNSPDGWDRSEAWELARRIAGADVTCDADGAEARRFGAKTSGHAVLTDPAGAVVFRGGLTPARGRTGENVGLNAVRAWSDGRSGASSAPVFGCDLFTPDE